MSYELNIVRRFDWSNNEEKSNIALEEWLKYAEQDPELTKSDELNEYEWTAYPYKEANGTPWFKYNDGYVRSKNPDLLVIKKMLVMATAMNAKVQGEEGELYDESFLEALQ